MLFTSPHLTMQTICRASCWLHHGETICFDLPDTNTTTLVGASRAGSRAQVTLASTSFPYQVVLEAPGPGIQNTAVPRVFVQRERLTLREFAPSVAACPAT